MFFVIIIRLYNRNECFSNYANWTDDDKVFCQKKFEQEDFADLEMSKLVQEKYKS